MFKNAIKKIAAVGLVFSLCAPCCFASAQSFGGNGMNIPMGSPANQQNRAVDEDFLRRVLNIRIPAELLNQQQQRQPTALERFWNEFGGPQGYFTYPGGIFRTASEFANYLRGQRITDPAVGLLFHTIHSDAYSAPLTIYADSNSNLAAGLLFHIMYSDAYSADLTMDDARILLEDLLVDIDNNLSKRDLHIAVYEAFEKMRSDRRYRQYTPPGALDDVDLYFMQLKDYSDDLYRYWIVGE